MPAGCRLQRTADAVISGADIPIEIGAERRKRRANFVDALAGGARYRNEWLTVIREHAVQRPQGFLEVVFLDVDPDEFSINAPIDSLETCLGGAKYNTHHYHGTRELANVAL